MFYRRSGGAHGVGELRDLRAAAQLPVARLARRADLHPLAYPGFIVCRVGLELSER
jgi:hypothetical protein